jgi:energy-coupling factor transporter ATP-binding protein EcfA2
MQLTCFKVTNYRNVWDTGWIEANKFTAFVGQNEAGKSNLFEALYRINPFVPNETYIIDEDWPVDDWGNKDASAVVCEAKFSLIAAEIEALYAEAAIPPPQSVEPSPGDDGQAKAREDAALKAAPAAPALPAKLVLIGSRSYSRGLTFAVSEENAAKLDPAKVDAWRR